MEDIEVDYIVALSGATIHPDPKKPEKWIWPVGSGIIKRVNPDGMVIGVMCARIAISLHFKEPQEDSYRFNEIV